jgi:regulator of protease activity HflC (stomatin/prohibitin superfamily)
MGKFYKTLSPVSRNRCVCKWDETLFSKGLNFLIPIVDTVKHVQSLKEIAIDIPSQTAISKDNVTLNIDGVLYLKIFDPYLVCS